MRLSHLFLPSAAPEPGTFRTLSDGPPPLPGGSGALPSGGGLSGDVGGGSVTSHGGGGGGQDPQVPPANAGDGGSGVDEDLESDDEYSFTEVEDIPGKADPMDVTDGGDPNSLGSVVHIGSIRHLDVLLSTFDETIDGQVNYVEQTKPSFATSTKKGCGLEPGKVKTVCRNRMKMVSTLHLVIPPPTEKTPDGKPIPGSNTYSILYENLHHSPHGTILKRELRDYVGLALELDVPVIVYMPDQQETKLPLQKQFGFVTVFGKNQIRTACPDSPYLDAQKLTDFSFDILHHPNDADSKSASKGKGKCDKRGNTRLEDGKASNQSCIINDIGLPAPATRVIPKEVNKNLLYSYRVGLSALARQVMTEITTPSRFQPYALARLAKLEEEDPTGKFLFDSNYHALNGLLARNVTATHVDNLNCGKPGMGYVLTVISVVLLNEIAYRSSGISASRASVGIHQAQDGCCRPFLTMLYEWYDSLPLEQKEITRNLLHSSADPIAKGPSQAPVDIPVHMDKCLMYSNVLGIVANTCAKLNYLNAGDSSNEFVNAILFSCLLTNNMNYSWEFSQELMNGGIPRPKDGVSLVQAAIAYYKKISQQIKSKMRRPSKGARHQPHSGKCEFTAEEIAGALQRIADVRVAISSSSTFTSADYNKASDLAMLVPCVGDFLKHTVVVVLAMLACKTGYLHHEDIVSPKTQTGKRLMEVLVFSEEAPDKEQSSSTLVALIKAITRRCKCTSIAAENMICEYFRNQGKNKRVIRDLRLPGVPLVFYYIPKAQWSVWVHSSSAPVSLENYILSLGIMSRYGKQNFHSQISDINSPIAKKTRSSRQTSLAVIKHAASTGRRGSGPHLRSCSISASSLSDSDSLSSRSDNVQPVLPGHAHLSQKPLASYPCVQTNLNELLAAILGYHGNFVLKDAVTFCTKRISELKQRKGSKAPNTCHSVAFSACLVCASGNVCHYSASSSPAIHLFDRYCLFTSKDGKVFFQDKFTSIKYAIWSTLLQDSNAQHLQTFLAGLFDLPLFPLSEENDPDRVDSPGRLLLQPYARDRSSSHSYVVQRDSQHYEVGLISKKGHRLGSGVIITPP